MEAKIGDRVSLNVSKRLYYFQGEGGISLSADDKVSDIIPKSISDAQLQQINTAIRNEHLIIGEPEKKVDLPDRDSDIRTMLEAGRNKINDWMFDLKADKTKTTPVKFATIEKIIEMEKAGKNRQSVIKTAENILASIGGVSKVEETEQEAVEIKLTPTESVTDEPEKSVEIK